MTNNTYQGWTNEETFVVAYQIIDTHEKYNHWRNQAEWWMKTKENPIESLAKDIENHVRTNSPLPQIKSNRSYMYTDLLNRALSNVNWREIAKTRILHEREQECTG